VTPALRTALLAALLAAACATPPAGARRCPESVERCATRLDCAMDARRDCLVCTCRAWNEAGPVDGAAKAVPETAPPAR
jgi:hypothetical protein